MNIRTIKDFNELQKEEPTVLVLGYFDGIHLGHKALFERARKVADERGLTVTVLTFPESPRLAFSRFTPELLLHLTSEGQRYLLLEKYGVDQLVMTPFTSEFASNTPEEFIERYVKGLNAQVLVAGFDYHFGNCRADVKDLTELFDGQVEIVSEVSLGGEKVSSTRIRQAIQSGDVTLANQLLGYPFMTEGIVVHGDARGRTIGYPTANLAPFDRVYLPSEGVYVAEVEVDGKRYRAMTSVGKNVTFDGTEMRIEAHIFGFDRFIYGEKITIFWLEKIRDMVKFDGIESLMEQMKSDENYALHWTSK
ncbi:bifunctional riboflavin kinase/FAD synthetase [Streptococcus parasuis]|uniref:bifunctional riboflavin kinase/FAD synthetase n=1 Tax=Streptococcus TaxID=1301 RepID=UPI001C2B824E|nr:bifunctional riboflavin kinase/FAD synthetase [Streptococcus parasuis]MDG3181861.1 bifunctional riboflavin kinase/FAD synthetase [Streptococcus suis]MBV1943555.1 bifunctional riboflavin kinase/FAD synthetase [Streptococcus parasuis]MDG3212880.1 bifunctional riboflavin kinase/FAD synthetase [Streptococcus suis]QXF06159.1 bifunctional riboflavin kinase/FAD synthetase [Streptococcus parasuis]WDM38200.1 bifunctional riboflavin kinase/FAD synthetase [Streptococcus parasuis]